MTDVVWQLRGDAGARQADAPRIAVSETMGGGVGGLDGNACVVSVLESERPPAAGRARVDRRVQAVLADGDAAGEGERARRERELPALALGLIA